MFEPGEKVELLPERHSGVIYHGLTYTVQEYCDVTDTCVVTNGEYTTPNVPAEYLGLVHETTQSINNEQVDLNKKFCEAADSLQRDKQAKSALSTQVAGSHYKDMVIQPIEYSMKNNLDACQHSVIKYVSRCRSKEDLEKAKHCIDLLIELRGMG